MYSKFGSPSSQLIVLPFNQGMNFLLAIYILRLINSQETNRMSRPSLTTSVMRRMVLVGILAWSFLSMLFLKRGAGSGVSALGRVLPIESC